MKCNKSVPCPNCPFLKEPASQEGHPQISAQELSKKALSEKGFACIDSTPENEIRCAGSIIFASLSNKIFKDKKTRYYQSRLGKNSDVFNKDELLLEYKKEIT